MARRDGTPKRRRIFGIKETLLYHKWREKGAIKAILVKGTGRTRGKRLFDFHSIAELSRKPRPREYESAAHKKGGPRTLKE